ncbi:hypothetical protein [Natrialbaceae archaeon AArc-T1-2]|uniref:hypothetical protein n=1 Tax=Natrialbaceae archaeon AArc-T1-2 TaxID=3053904 RepID=UPI00255A9D4B|nr:hypothetical protein [Natrialbaceae archaeon AArc-T1-2]WIV68794.1 hypothetical protein QQ977_16865 [Natrialbaceae archaeon AArc-T1-2]
MIQHDPPRRTVLCGIATGAAAAVSGCLNSSDNGETDSGDDGVFTTLDVEGTDLVIELTEEASIDQVNVIDPDGELFAERWIAAGVDRETVELGTDYQPGEYEIVALEDDTEQTTQSITLEPDVQITDLRLARNHPDDMFEDASDIDIRTETILTLENTGTGPDAAVGLYFSGDIPRPTPDEYEESGIYDTDSDIRRDADSVALPPGEGVTIYSQLMPFSESGGNVSCSPDTTEGDLRVVLETAVQESFSPRDYAVTYTGEDLAECEIEVEVNP